MAVRWVINPVIETLRTDGKVKTRRPKVALIEDPGNPGSIIDEFGVPHPGFFNYAHVSVISSGQPGEINDWCLSQVWGEDFGPLDADPEIIDVLEFDYPGEERLEFLEKTMGELGLGQAKQARIRGRVRAKGAQDDGIGAGSRYRHVLERLGARIRPGFDPRLEHTRHIPRS